MVRTHKKKRTYKKRSQSQWRPEIARQIQNAQPRPARAQLVRMVYTNSCYLKPSIVGNVQPCNGFRIAVNRPHHLLDATHFTSGATPQETWTMPLQNQGTMPHLDSWTEKYENYLVRGCKVTITFRTESNSTVSDRSGKIFLCRHTNTGDISEATTALSLRDNNQMTKLQNVSPTTSTVNQARMSMGYSPSRYFAVNKSALSADDTLEGTLSPTGNIGPESTVFISLGYLSPFINATTGEYTMPEGLVEIKIEQLVEFVNPRQFTSQQPLAVAN